MGTQLLMPIEIRNKKTNRIIVSQIIRSPGIYFEKNKKQKRRKFNKLILSNDYSKVRPFTQTATGLLKTPYLSFLSIDSDEEFQFFKFLLKSEYIETNLKFLDFF